MTKKKLSGDEIRELIFGTTISGDYSSDVGGIQAWKQARTKDGKAAHRGTFGTYKKIFRGDDKGSTWIQDDMVGMQWQKNLNGRCFCGPIYKNPESKPGFKDEYLIATEFGVIAFSPLD